jgi:uncharacterized membrane protein
MATTRAFLTGAALGAGAVYFLDARHGARRRALIGQKVRRLSRQVAEGADAGWRDLQNRTHGLAADPMSMFSERRKYVLNTPAGRLIEATIGTALMANCVARRTPGAIVLGTLGFGLAMRAITESGPASRLDGRSAITVQQSIEVGAPAERVYAFFTHPENWAKVSDVVTSVELLGDGRFAKNMLIAGVPARFEERYTRCEPSCLIESHSTPSSAIPFCKQLRIEEAGERTRVHLTFRYSPPGGIVGHGIASLFGFDAKSVLSDLLMRAKFFLETGRQPHDATECRQQRQQSSRGRSRVSSGEHFPRPQDTEYHGTGAPDHDVMPTSGEVESGQRWPESTATEPVHAGAGHFPPAI